MSSASTSCCKKDGKNALAVEIFAPEKNDLGLTWVDWNPTPPDKDMGIWREVFLSDTGDVSLRHPFVSFQTRLGLQIRRAHRSAPNSATPRIIPSKPRSHADVAGAKLSQPVELAANETKTVRLHARTISAAQTSASSISGGPTRWASRISTPRNSASNSAADDSDSANVNFGIREVTSELTDNGGRLFKVNGKRVLIRGAAWAPDMLLRWSSKRLDADLAYVKHMGLNSIRLEGKTDRDEFFDKTDRLGLLVMPGWICCDAWEHWKHWTPETKKIAAASLVDQITRLRNHPSVFVWLYGSDNPPPPDIENMYLGILKDLRVAESHGLFRQRNVQPPSPANPA